MFNRFRCWALVMILAALATGYFGCKKTDNEPEMPCGPGTPTIEFTSVPSLGSFSELHGQVCHVMPRDYGVAVFIFVSGWWTKPYFDSPVTPIAEDGSWVCDIATGGYDTTATRIAAFLIPSGYTPASLSGESDFPDDLTTTAVAKAEVKRGAGGISPNAPGDLTAVLSGERAVNLSWQDNSANEDGFIVYRQGNELARVSANITAYQDPKVFMTGDICYAVASYNDVDVSDQSNSRCVQIAELPPINYKDYGFCFGPFIGSQNPNAGSQVSAQQVRDRLTLIAPYTNWVRTYGTDGGLAEAGQIAHQLGLKIAMGAWISTDSGANAVQMDGLIAAAQAGEVDIAIVGSEALLRSDVTADALIGYINQFKQAVPDVPVTTSDTYRSWLNNQKLFTVCDVAFTHHHPYWEGVALGDALAAINRSYLQLVAVSGGKTVYLAETGWPSDGYAKGEAVPSQENAAFFYLNFVSWAKTLDVPYFYFEAFDEPWKAAYEPNGVGDHWGVFDTNAGLKAGMEKVFAGETMPDNWTREKPCGDGDPSIAFTYVPPYGSSDDLKGQACHVWPQDYNVVVYIYVGGSWWLKPYWSERSTPIGASGNWVCDITTGGIDELASSILAYLIPFDYSPPDGPDADLESHAVAKIQVNR